MFSCCFGPSQEDLELQQEIAKLKHNPETANKKSVTVLNSMNDDNNNNNLSNEEIRAKLKKQEEYGTKLHAECKSPKVDISNLRRIVSACPESVRYASSVSKEYALHILCKNKRATPEMVHFIAYEWPMAARHASASDGSMPLHYACEAQLPFSVIKYIMDLYEQANMVPNELGMWPFHLACFHETGAKTIEYMLQVHPQLITKRTKGGLLALHLACEFPNRRVLEVLIEQDPKALQEVCPEGNTALHIAVANDASMDCVEYLVQSYKPAITVANHKGDLPLHMALKEPKSSKSKKNKLKVITYLVEKNWNATVVLNRNGNLPIHIACGNKAPLKIIEYLVSTSPDTLKRQTTKQGGYTPLHVACQVKSNVKVITFLVTQWKDALQIPTTDADGNYPIHIACSKQCSLQVIQCLARRWPDSLKKKNAHGQTPVDVAMNKNINGNDNNDDDDDDSNDGGGGASDYKDVITWLTAVSSGKLPIQPSLREQLSMRQFSFR